MNKQFSIVINNNRFVFARNTALLVLILNVIMLSALAVYSQHYSYFAGVALIFISILGIIIPNLSKKFPQAIPVGYLCAILAWMLIGEYWIGIGVIALWFLNSLIRKKFIFVFTADKIVVNTRPQKVIKWFELENAMLKDGLLSIDYKNNKIIQVEILQEESDAVNEMEFNQFCRERLNANDFSSAV